MNSLDKQYRVWAEDKSEANLNHLLQLITRHFKGDVEEGDHVAQEVCFKVWGNIHKFQPHNDNSFKAWVNTIGRLEKRTLLSARLWEMSKREFLADDPDDAEDGLSAVEKLENILHLQTAQDYDSISKESSARAKKVAALLMHEDEFVRKYAEYSLQGKTDQQIAKEIDMKYGTLRKKLFDFRKKVTI